MWAFSEQDDEAYFGHDGGGDQGGESVGPSRTARGCGRGVFVFVQQGGGVCQRGYFGVGWGGSFDGQDLGAERNQEWGEG